MQPVAFLLLQKRIFPSHHNSKLLLYLPSPVDHKRGNAKWDTKKTALVISLPVASAMDRLLG